MKNKGTLTISIGLLLITAALFLTIYNLIEQNHAQKSTFSAAVQLEQLIPPYSSDEPAGADDEIVFPDYILNPDMDMPVQNIDDIDYIGVLSLPSLGLELPVASQWSYPNLKIAPCRYDGSAYLENLVICAHNYQCHFASLGDLRIGDTLTFTDIDGNMFLYEVSSIETLQPNAVDEMTSGEWALTLFTCTTSGQSRITVRCSPLASN